MRHGGFVLAYHGCDREIGEQVLAGKVDVRLSENDYDWLGKGAYFWENSPARALQWARFIHDHPARSTGRVKDPFVVGAIIAPGNCLDLSDAACLDILKLTYLSFAEIMAASNTELPANEKGHAGDADLIKRKLDCAVMNFLHTLRESKGQEPFETVRCPFFEGEPIYKGAGIAARTHIQWCVRNPVQNVVGYFRPRAK